MENQNKTQFQQQYPWLSRLLVSISYFIRAIWFFFPGLLFVILGGITFTFTAQGRDLLEQSLTLNWCAKLPIVIGLSFWAFTSWYTSRILAYNDNEFHENSGKTVTLFPRFIGYINFTLLGIAYCKVECTAVQSWLFTLISLAIFAFVSAIAVYGKFKKILPFLNNPGRYKLYMSLMVIGLLMLLFVWKAQSLWPLMSLLLIQIGALCWVSFRNPKTQPAGKSAPKAPQCIKDDYLLALQMEKYPKFGGGFLQCVYRNKIGASIRKGENPIAFLDSEYPIFLVYNFIALLAICIYLIIICNVYFGRLVGSFAFVLFAFGILLGLGNVIAFASVRSKINLHFFFIMSMLILGRFCEPHPVRVTDLTEKNAYSQRPDLKTHLNLWLNVPERKSILLDPAVDSFPVIFVLADGGASRSGYWAANALSRLHQKTLIDTTDPDGRSYFSRHLLALAGASGGSVGNVTFLAALKAQHEKPGLFTDSLCKQYLSSDFLTFPLARLMGPELINLGQWGDRAAALEKSMENPENINLPGMRKLSDIMASDIKQFLPHEKNTNWIKPILCINTTCMQDGRPGIIINIKDSIFYPRLDVLDLMEYRKSINVSTAMVLGARFPYFSPAGHLSARYYVDGGYFDNSGAGPILQLMFGIEKLRMVLNEQKDTSFLSKALNKLSFHVIHLQNNPLKEKRYKKVHPLNNDLAAPLITLMGSYGAQTNFNDHRLSIHLSQINGIYRKLNLYRTKEDAFPMNWALSDTAVAMMDRRVLENKNMNMIIDKLNSGYTTKKKQGTEIK